MLGGTSFLSAAVAQRAIDLGHQVECVARGRSGRVPEHARWIDADRHDGASAFDELTGHIDEVVDVANDPSLVRVALEVLGPRTSHWTYVSSCSVYADNDQPGGDEDAAVLEPLEDGEPFDIARFGEAKVAAERLCVDALGDRLHITRPGLIGGPGDVSDRTGYWPARFARHPADAVLVPRSAKAMVQIIDVADLAAWVVTAAEERLTGVMNAVGVETPLHEALELARGVAGHDAEVVAVDEDFLVDHGVAAWMGEDSLPLWIASGTDTTVSPDARPLVLAPRDSRSDH